MKPKKLFKVHYVVDTGYTHCADTAIVKAEDEQTAIEKLECYIAHSGYDHMVEKVISVTEFTDEVFSNQFKFSFRKEK